MIRILQLWLIGMTLPFVLRTILVYGFGIDVPEMVWLWKELIIGGLLVGSLWLVVFGRKRRSGINRISSMKELFADKFLLTMIGLLLTLLILSAILAFGVHDQLLREWIVFIKYDIIPRIVLLTGYIVVRLQWWYERLAKTMQTIISVLLVVGIARRGLSVWLPDLLVSLGYSMDAYQWSEWFAPPVRYLTQVRWGYIRNGSIFGGPTSWGFFLIAFAPWYIWRWSQMVANGSKWWHMVFWIVLLTVNVGLTFSRAAWGVFLVELLLVLVVHFLVRRFAGTNFLAWSKKYAKKSSLAAGACSTPATGVDLANTCRTPATTNSYSSVWCSVVSLFVAVWLWMIATIGLIRVAWPVDVPQAADRDQGVLMRDLSDKGHVELLIEWIQKVWQSPRTGYGVASVWPGAYRAEDGENTIVYHPENQYIQILMEVGIIGFVLWVALWVAVGRNGIRRRNGRNSDGTYLLLGAVWLGIVWLVLHSMMESMSIYPWMLMMGARLGYATKQYQE